MATTELKTQPKITVQIWRPVIDQFNKKIEAACLRRDAFLNRVLQIELPHLDAEVSIANSEAAQRYLADQLDTLDRKIVSLSLQPELVAQLNDICRRKRIGRDSFFNRLFLLLAAKPKLIDQLYGLGNDWREDVLDAYRHDGAMFHDVFYPLELNVDPLWPIRAAFELSAAQHPGERWTHPETGQEIQIDRTRDGSPLPIESIYTSWKGFTTGVLKGVDLTGLNVYLPDTHVPGTSAQSRQTLNDMMDF